MRLGNIANAALAIQQLSKDYDVPVRTVVALIREDEEPDLLHIKRLLKL